MNPRWTLLTSNCAKRRSPRSGLGSTYLLMSNSTECVELVPMVPQQNWFRHGKSGWGFCWYSPSPPYPYALCMVMIDIYLHLGDFGQMLVYICKYSSTMVRIWVRLKTHPISSTCDFRWPLNRPRDLCRCAPLFHGGRRDVWGPPGRGARARPAIHRPFTGHSPPLVMSK
jgi:hypothetical protein